MDSSEATQSELAALRAEIDEIDQQIMLLLGVRFRCTDMIGELKQAHGLDPADPQRAAQQIDRIRHLAIDAGVPPDLAATVLRAIIDTVVDHHRQQRERRYS
ncbi:chorismate mutase [Bordetella sp. BOR01]|uniref:chorismate mutase n=1 Tax=Bordetella sp. BOR01 TaxID=2854779 RepID=UPI001C43ABA4|nr:chorismate mutase [Bordetella sp. BOR01]MBV7485632.1 chorismate mutase [Bordetella sp. BOR01]